MAATTRRLLISSRRMTPEEQADLKESLRDAILFMAGLKVCAAFSYLGLFVLVHFYSEGFWSTLLKVMIGIIIPIEVLNGLILFLGALERRSIALKIGAFLCLFVAVFNTIMGMIGALFFFRIGDKAIHFIISIIFVLIALCFCSVLCHDVIVLFMFIKLIENRSPYSSNPPETLEITTNNP